MNKGGLSQVRYWHVGFSGRRDLINDTRNWQRRQKSDPSIFWTINEGFRTVRSERVVHVPRSFSLDQVSRFGNMVTECPSRARSLDQGAPVHGCHCHVRLNWVKIGFR
jgi:hypothetical protein